MGKSIENKLENCQDCFSLNQTEDTEEGMFVYKSSCKIENKSFGQVFLYIEHS
jgi:hypothetical protein